MRQTRGRLARLEARLAPPACPGCRGWDVWFAVGDDGGHWSRPEVYPACGRVVPQRRVVVIVGIDVDWL